ncbi:MAG TPA: (2Fe-2S)-binding protein [Gemmataceae bacterium]|jgi:aerobic-type carbon monoxide dehydrogenase small subunit (CoxS/CutS family)|nr:(2Fe-2S)-binding protein [Gemmataceae bacterium]
MATVTELHINGAPCRVQADAERSLLQVLRHDLDLTGSKYGCGEGKCGACTVLIDGQPTRSCITQVGVAAGKQIQTIESLEQNGRLHALQQAFLDADALQCGYCTAGMIMAGLALLKSNSNPANQDIVQALRGNICRCGTYARIVTAIKLAARMLKEAHHG